MLLNHRAPLDNEISWRWRATRLLAVSLPLLTTGPLIWAVGRLTEIGRRHARSVADGGGDD